MWKPGDNKMDKDTLWNKIKKMSELSTLPEVYTKIAELIDDPRTSAATLASVISRDQVLTAKLLRMASSPFYRASAEKITSITFAVAILGFNATKNLVLSASLFDLFHDFEKDFQAVVRSVWEHSIACAVGSKIIAQYIRYKQPEEMFVIGLLHDIGKIVELQIMPKEFREIINLTSDNGLLIKDAEEQILGYTHSYVGKLLGKHWNLSPQIINSVEFHHSPEEANEFQIPVSIVHIADVFSHTLELGEVNSKIPILNNKSCELLELKVSMIEPILRELKREWKDAVAFLFPVK